MIKLLGLASLIKGISTSVGYLIPKPSYIEELKWYYLTHIGKMKKFIHFSKALPKANKIAQLKFKFTYLEAKDQQLKHCLTRTLLWNLFTQLFSLLYKLTMYQQIFHSSQKNIKLSQNSYTKERSIVDQHRQRLRK